jgi:hypothetical protein
MVNRPITWLLQSRLLMESLLKETPVGHYDWSSTIQLLKEMKTLNKETEPGVASSVQKVAEWRYNSNLVFESGE